jgi:putative two-component system response regulator
MASNAHILIVDDVSENIQVAMNLLQEDGYEFSFANDGAKALELIEQKGDEFDLILLDIMMPNVTGFEVCERVKQLPNRSAIPIIFLTARTDIDSISRGFEIGGVDYLTKPFHGAELLARVKTHIELYQAKKILQRENITLTNKVDFTRRRLLTELEDTQKEVIWMLTELMESTSDETGKHIRRVAELSALFARLHPSLTEDDANVLYHASPMHDVGKMTIPHEILHKNGRYSQDEYEVMKRHTTNAYELLSHSQRKLIKSAAIIAYEHHEKWDGSGYPRGLKANEIHIYGRVVALVDVLDALTHKRCYKDAWTIDEAVQFIVEGKGTHFDPVLVDLLLENLDQVTEILEIV